MREKNIVLLFYSNLLCVFPSSSDYANYYQCLWNCQADESDELTFHRGDLIYIISKVSITISKNNPRGYLNQNSVSGHTSAISSNWEVTVLVFVLNGSQP